MRMYIQDTVPFNRGDSAEVDGQQGCDCDEYQCQTISCAEMLANSLYLHPHWISFNYRRS